MFKYFKILTFLFVLLIFCYFRLKPLYFQTVGYTYDQGRDFLKTAEIILDKNITFIGPTTGIQGLFHGAWYYYLLIIPFLIFRGVPISFYYFNFIIQFASFLLFIYFLNKYFGSVVALIISLIVATSPYFIFTSVFVGNNLLVLPMFLAFLLTNFNLLEQKNKNTSLYMFMNGLFLGFVTEFELAFGLFLIPAYAVSVFIYKKLRSVFFSLKYLRFFLSGLIIPFIPRLLFEIKNNFTQTKILLSHLLIRTQDSPHLFSEAIQDRLNLFFSYYRMLFFADHIFLIFTILVVIFFIYIFEKAKLKSESTFHFFLSLTALLFLYSALNKDTFFWVNYYEGIQYLLLFILAFILTVNKSLTLSSLKICLLAILFIYSVISLKADVKKKPATNGTLKQHVQIVDYIQSNTARGKYCVKIYTPPVIPFTYNYLFLYRKISKNIPTPMSVWADRKCWFIIEPDENNERRAEWLDKNIPRKAKLTNKKSFNEVEVVLHQLF